MGLRHWMTSLAVVVMTAAPALAQDNKDHHRDARQAQQEQHARREQPQPQRQAPPPQAQRQAPPQVQRQAPQQVQRQAQPQVRQNERAVAVPRAAAPAPQQIQRRAEAFRPNEGVRRDEAVRRDQAARVPDRGVAVGRPQVVTPQYNGRYSSGYAGSRHYVFASPRIIRPTVIQVLPYRPYVYRPSWSIGVFYGNDGYYPYGYTPDYYFNPIPGHYYGGLRITGAPRSAHVFADGYYVGIVDDFDGIFQHMNLEVGPHHIEIQAEGFAPVAFDVDIRPGQTITFRADQAFFQPYGN